jgi:hypothetical protein
LKCLRVVSCGCLEVTLKVDVERIALKFLIEFTLQRTEYMIRMQFLFQIPVRCFLSFDEVINLSFSGVPLRKLIISDLA